MNFPAEYSRLIAELDCVISTVRDFWLGARAAAEAAHWRVRLDQLLDERLRLMRLRDTRLA